MSEVCGYASPPRSPGLLRIDDSDTPPSPWHSPTAESSWTTPAPNSARGGPALFPTSTSDPTLSAVPLVPRSYTEPLARWITPALPDFSLEFSHDFAGKVTGSSSLAVSFDNRLAAASEVRQAAERRFVNCGVPLSVKALDRIWIDALICDHELE